MRDYTNNTPTFSEALKITEITDPAHADVVNTAPIQIFQNTLCNRKSIGQLKQSAFSVDEYQTEMSYRVGEYCLYQNVLHKCVQETTGEWNPDCWQQTSALGEIEGLRGTIVHQEAVISSLEEMLKTGKVLANLTTREGRRFVTVSGAAYKAMVKKIQFE